MNSVVMSYLVLVLNLLIVASVVSTNSASSFWL